MRPFLLGLASLLVAGVATAQNPPAGSAPRTQKAGYSDYEKETIAAALDQLGARIEPRPEGKTVEAVQLVRLEVIEKRDPAPRLLNLFHAVSQDYVIRREVLLHPGQPYRETLLDESARNLRRLSELSLVIGVPLQGSTPDSVRVLVITKDIWSLRLAYDMALSSGGLESLVITPTEINLAGTHHTVSGNFALTPLSYSLGAGYVVPRFGSSYVGASAQAAIVMNRERGEPEGTTGALAVTQPLTTSLMPWAWSASGKWTTNVLRRYVNARLASFDSPLTPGADAVPFEYKQRNLTVGAALTRSFGWRYKSDVSVGYELERRLYRSFDREGIDPVALDDFNARFVPTSDLRSAPYAQLHWYTTDFHRIVDFQTLALQEDYRLGHDVYLRVAPVLQTLGSTRNFVATYASAQYTLPLGDGIVRAGLQAITEGNGDGLADASLLGNLRIVTPRFGLGRVVFDAAAMNRYRNYLNTQTFLGGDTRLRGFPSNYLVGKDYVVYNLEYRSRPVSLFSVQLGAAVFYDVGDAARGFSELSPKQSAGVGLRALIPQLNRVVFRADLGFPLTRPLPAGVSPAAFFMSFEQAFGFGSLDPS